MRNMGNMRNMRNMWNMGTIRLKEHTEHGLHNEHVEYGNLITMGNMVDARFMAETGNVVYMTSNTPYLRRRARSAWAK